jgi:hypothetical protein
MIPAGYRAYLLGVVSSFDELSTVTPLEESGPEGALMLMKLDFAEAPSIESLARIELELIDAGVPMWPGQGSHIRIEGTSIYISWVKGIAWTSVIVGILLLVVLPLVLGGVVWMLLPETVKEMINMMVLVGVMVLMMKFMSGAIEGARK